MSYNSMDAMLMGGILPSQITKELVDGFIKTEFTRKKSFIFATLPPVTGGSWFEILQQLGATDEEYERILAAITNFLRISAQYGLIDGPATLARLRTARIRLMRIRRPLLDAAIRIMKDMRRATGNRMSDLRKAFIREGDPLKALRLMQFAPGFSYYNHQLLPLPVSLQKRLAGYYDDQDKMNAAIRRADKRRKAIANYTALETFEADPYNSTVSPVTRVKDDFGLFRAKTTDPVRLQRANQARDTYKTHNRDYVRELEDFASLL